LLYVKKNVYTAYITVSFKFVVFKVLLKKLLFRSTPAMSNSNDLLSQKLCHYLNQGRALNGLL